MADRGTLLATAPLSDETWLLWNGAHAATYVVDPLTAALADAERATDPVAARQAAFLAHGVPSEEESAVLAAISASRCLELRPVAHAALQWACAPVPLAWRTRVLRVSGWFSVGVAIALGSLILLAGRPLVPQLGGVGGVLFVGWWVCGSVVHEIGHALVYGAATGLPTVIGVRRRWWIVPQPFANVSAMSELPDAVAVRILSAGVMLDGLFILTTAAVLRWTDATAWHILASGVLGIPAIATLCNFMPLPGTDGYLLLTRWLGRPRLSADARVALASLVSSSTAQGNTSAALLVFAVVERGLWALIAAIVVGGVYRLGGASSSVVSTAVGGVFLFAFLWFILFAPARAPSSTPPHGH